MIVNLRARKGFSIAVVLLVIAVVLVIGITVATIGVRNLGFLNKDSRNTRAFYVAEAGLSKGIAKIKTDNNWNGYNTGTTTLTFNETVLQPGGDKFTVQVYNNFFGTADMPNCFRSISVPKGYCYIVAGGKTGTPGSGGSVKYAGVMLSMGTPFDQFGVFGDSSVLFKGNMSIDAYDSSTSTQKPGEGDAGTNGHQQGAITVLGTSGYVDGSLYAGPGSTLGTNGAISISGQPTITGDEQVLLQPNPMPEVILPTGLPVMNIPAITGNTNSLTLTPASYNGKLSLSNKDVVTLTGPGTYIFKGIDIQGQGELRVDTSSGPVKIYVDGSVNLTGGADVGGIYNINNVGLPKTTDLRIYGTENCTNFDFRGHSQAYAGIYAPNAQINLRGDGTVYGALIGKDIIIHGNPAFHYDVALSKVANDVKVIRVESWQRF
ncbi:MAG: hypothetical protein LWY06_01660 [Firmicutes bacterium]|nr:hypothetical protein [Bacillota bacterium]